MEHYPYILHFSQLPLLLAGFHICYIYLICIHVYRSQEPGKRIW
jgi:hypothetical protein